MTRALGALGELRAIPVVNMVARAAFAIEFPVNDLVAVAEDPVKSLEELVAEIVISVKAVRENLAGAVTEQKDLEKGLAVEEADRDAWERRARDAVQAGDDELAEQALARVGAHEQRANAMRAECASAKQRADVLKNLWRALGAKILECERKRKLLRARMQGTANPPAIAHVMERLRDESAADAWARTSRELEALERAQAQRPSVDDLEARFAKLADDGDEGSAELEALKKRVLGAKVP